MLLGVYGLFIGWNLLFAFLVFSVHYPLTTAEGFMDGTREAVQYIKENESKYSEIVFDPVRGTDGPSIVSVPHLYYLFYTQYDPQKFQSETKIEGNDAFSFDHFTVRKIDWREDRLKNGTLFIGSQWSLPEQDLKPGQELKKVMMINGKVAYVIVTP